MSVPSLWLNLATEYGTGDVAHTLILGATGSGKSFLISFLLQAIQKYKPLTFIFDLGASYESLTRVFGGFYLNVGLKSPGFRINPFSLAPTNENLNFLYLFTRVLIEANGRYRLTPEDDRALYAGVERVYKLTPRLRTLSNFTAILGPLGERLDRWTCAGQFTEGNLLAAIVHSAGIQDRVAARAVLMRLFCRFDSI